AAAPPAPPAVPLTDDLLESYRAAAGSPAFAAAADKGGRRRAWATGERVRGMGLPVSTDDKWHMGSITKSMTATLVARLVDEGAIAWTDTVGDLLGQTAPDMQPAYRPTTFRHLLSHRAGLPGNLPLTELVKFARDNDDPREERRAYARQALAMAPSGPAETTFEYANNGYVVAGAMLEAKLGESWETLARRHLFEPLGLRSAGFGAPGAKGTLDQPAGHAMLPPGSGRRMAFRIGDAPTDNPAVLGPAGRAHLSMADLITYLAAHRDRSAFLKPESWRTLHTPPFGGDYALGWNVRKDGSLWHNGSNTLWYAEAAFHPGEGIAWAAVANDGSPPTSPAVGRAAIAARAAV
ncbi:MAG TPA: serine hydrolase domain-containing protein, partial [Phenylobacterium sp.]|nr:serine hydrolase domain-containing protein [Phenylobacterium sp.]